MLKVNAYGKRDIRFELYCAPGVSAESADRRIHGCDTRLARQDGDYGSWGARGVEVQDDRYTDHGVFIELERYAAFYESLSFSTLFLCSAGATIPNFDSYFYSSVQGTTESIHDVLKNGRINDAYALLRKYHDSVIINVYSDLYLQDHLGDEALVVAAIDNWLKGTGQLPRFHSMLEYIYCSDKVAAITGLLRSDNRYKDIRDRCNSHVHYNLFANALLNDSNLVLDTRLEVLDAFLSDLADLFIFHFAYMFLLNGHYMASSDYMGSLECGIEPEADSQHWVAPFVQETFDGIVAVRRPDVAEAIRQRTCMRLE